MVCSVSFDDIISCNGRNFIYWAVIMFFSVRKVSGAEINLLFEVYRNNVLESGQCGKMVCTLWNWTIVREAADLQWPAHQT